MKKCPNCTSVYNDDMLIKCPSCGADLIVENNGQQKNENTPPYRNTYGNYDQYANPPYKYCSRCGNQCDPKAVICVKCGFQFPQAYPQYSPANDKPSGLLKLISFFVPLVGLILYLINYKESPASAKAYGKMAIIGFIIGVVLYVAFVLILFLIPVLFAESFAPDTYLYDDSEIYFSIINGFTSLLR